MLFRRYRTSESEPGTPASLIYTYAGRDNRDDSNPVAREEPEDQLETDSADGSNGGQPESSPTTRKRGAPQGSQTSRTAKASTRAPQRPRDGQPESSAPAAKRGRPRSPKLPVRSKLTVRTKLPVQRSLVPGPGNGREMASENPLPQRQNGGRPRSPKLPVRSELTVRPKLPVQRRLVLGPRDGREIEVG